MFKLGLLTVLILALVFSLFLLIANTSPPLIERERLFSPRNRSMFSQFPGLANGSRRFPGVGREDSTGAFETKYLVANPSFAPGGNRQRTRHYSLCFEGKSVAMKS
jgi:hypothetical protein